MNASIQTRVEHRHQRGRRARQAGAVAVEAVIVVVMMTGIVLGTFFMRKVFSAKLLTLTAARADAWEFALNGCDSGNQGELYTKLHEKSKDPNDKVCANPADCSGASVEGLQNDGNGAPPGWFPTGSGQEGMRSITVDVDSWNKTLTTARKFSCNEKPSPELQLGSLDLLGSVADIAKKIPEEEVNEDTKAQKCMKQGLVGQWHEVDCATDWCFNGKVNCCITKGPACFAKREDVVIDQAPDNSIK